VITEMVGISVVGVNCICWCVQGATAARRPRSAVLSPTSSSEATAHGHSSRISSSSITDSNLPSTDC